MYTIQKATDVDAFMIHNLGHSIYHSTYSSILSERQILFMLEKNYSVEALQQSMTDGQDFYLIYDQQKVALGFMGLKEKDCDTLRIEKLYLLSTSQGLGLGKLLLNFAAKEGKKRAKSILELNVNRGNGAYFFYLKQGFHVFREVDIPYYDFVLDDFIMQKEI